jgi:hypothetical protein
MVAGIFVSNSNNLMRNLVMREATGCISHTESNVKGLFEQMEQKSTTFIFDMPMSMHYGMLEVSHKSSLSSASIFIMLT